MRLLVLRPGWRAAGRYPSSNLRSTALRHQFVSLSPEFRTLDALTRAAQLCVASEAPRELSQSLRLKSAQARHQSDVLP